MFLLLHFNPSKHTAHNIERGDSSVKLIANFSLSTTSPTPDFGPVIGCWLSWKMLSRPICHSVSICLFLFIKRLAILLSEERTCLITRRRTGQVQIYVRGRARPAYRCLFIPRDLPNQLVNILTPALGLLPPDALQEHSNASVGKMNNKITLRMNLCIFQCILIQDIMPCLSIHRLCSSCIVCHQ